MEMNKTPIAQSLGLIWSPHPLNPILDRAEKQIALRPGMTLREILVASDIDPHAEIVCTINGQPVRVAEWDTLVPVVDDVIQVQAVVSGGGDGDSNVLQIVAMVVLVIVANVYGEALGTALGFTGTTAAGVGAGLIMAAGSLMIGAIFKPSGLSAGNDVSGATTSPTYSLSGGQNRLRPYEPLPVLLGRHILYPDLNAKPYTEYLDGEQYLYQAFNFGLTPHMSLSDFKIGDTLLSDYDEAELVYLDASGKWPAGSGFYGNVDSSAAAVISSETGPVTRTTSLDTVRIGLDIEALLFFGTDAGTLAELAAEIKVEYRQTGTSTWLGFIPDNVTPLTHYWAKLGTVTKKVSEGYWHYAGEWVPPVTESTVRQFDFDTNLSPTAHVNGDSAGSAQFNVDYGLTGDGWSSESFVVPLTWHYVPIGTDPRPYQALDFGSNDSLVLRSSSAEQKRWSLYRKVPSGQYDVRVTRVTPDETNIKNRADINWSALKSYQADEGSYPHQTVVGLKIKATGQLNGVIQQFSAVAQALTPLWAGSAWAVQGSTNPAWWYLHFARGLRDDAGRLLYGAGMTDSQIDLDAIVAWAAFCDTNTLTFSGVLDSAQSCFDTLDAIARCGFGAVTWAPGKLSVVWDRVNAPVSGAYGMSNILAGTFSVQYITEDLAEEVVVSYMDQDTWKSQSIREVMPGLITAPARTSQITLWGCTNNAQAVRFARSILAGHVYRTRRITWEADAQGFVNTRGDVVRLSHDLTQWGYSGRLVAVNGATVTLDKAVPRNGAAEYLMIARPDGTLVDYTLTAGSGESDTLTATVNVGLQDNFNAIDHIWFFSPLATPGKRVKILSVQPLSQHRLRIVATDDVPEYYAAIGGSWTPPAVQTLLPLPVSLASVTLTASERLVDGAMTNVVSATWSPNGGVNRCRVEFYADGLLLAAYDDVRTTGKTVTVPAGEIRCVVTPFGVTGAGASQTRSVTVSAIAAPAAPTSVVATGKLFAIGLTWAFGDLRQDVACTEIYAGTGTLFADATLIASVPFPAKEFEHVGLGSAQSVRYWLRVRDTRGNATALHLTAGTLGTTSASADDLLDQLDGAIGSDQLAPELSEPIAQIPGMALDILQRVIDIDALTDRVLFERAVTDATISIDPVTGAIELLATANVTTDVEARLTAVETDLNAAEGTLTSTVATVATLETDVESAQSQLTLLAGEVSAKASTVYVDDAIETSTGALTVEAANNAQALAETALRQALGLDAATDKELAGRARIALAEQTLTTQAGELDAEAAARLALAAVVATGDQTNAAAIAAEETARANAVAAEATARQALAARVTTAEGTLTTQASQINDRYTKAQTDSAISGAISTLEASVGEDIATVTQAVTATANALGEVQAEWGVDVVTVAGGKRAMAGIKVLAGTDGESSIDVLADKFVVWKPDGSAGVPVFTLGTVNGQTALVLAGSLLADGMITAQHLNVSTLSAITADLGTVTAGRIESDDGDVVFDLDAGTLDMPGMSYDPVNGLVVSKTNVIGTPQIQMNAVTLSDGETFSHTGAPVAGVLASITMTFTDAPGGVALFAGFRMRAAAFPGEITVSLWREDVQVFSEIYEIGTETETDLQMRTDTPPAGTHTYELRMSNFPAVISGNLLAIGLLR